jgi:hypothetical protein
LDTDELCFYFEHLLTDKIGSPRNIYQYNGIEAVPSANFVVDISYTPSYLANRKKTL